MLRPSLLGLALLVSAATGASALSNQFTYSGKVTSSVIDSGGGTSFGATGDPASAMLELTYSPGETIPVGFTSGGLVDFSISSPDFSYGIQFSPEGFNDGFNSSIVATATRVSFFTSAGTFTWPNYDSNTLRTSFTVTFGTALGAAPTTYDQLAAALLQPGSSLVFLTNGDFNFTVAPGQVFSEYRAELSPNTVPLPASAWLVCAGLGALGLRGRRRAVA